MRVAVIRLAADRIDEARAKVLCCCLSDRRKRVREDLNARSPQSPSPHRFDFCFARTAGIESAGAERDEVPAQMISDEHEPSARPLMVPAAIDDTEERVTERWDESGDACAISARRRRSPVAADRTAHVAPSATVRAIASALQTSALTPYSGPGFALRPIADSLPP